VPGDNYPLSSEVNTVMPSLNSAIPRIDRARKHLNELRVLLDVYGQTEAEAATYHVQGYPPNVFEILPPDPPIPISPDGPILAGEIVNNLHSALDYLIYDLALLDSKKAQNTTKFPAESSAEAFNDHNPFTPKRIRTRTCPKCSLVTTRTIPKTDCLKGLNRRRVAALRTCSRTELGSG
jgi:hypothetical protein